METVELRTLEPVRLLDTSRQRLVRVLWHLLGYSWAFLACSTHGQGENKPEPVAVEVPLLRLIAAPQEFHGKVVRVSGVFRYEFEGTALYLTQEHFKRKIRENSIWLEIERPFRVSNAARLRNLAGTYVVVEGEFNANDTGHFGAYINGSLRRIKRIDAIQIPRRVG